MARSLGGSFRCRNGGRSNQLASQIGKFYACTVNVIARKNLEAFWQRHPEAEQPLRAWLMMAKRRNWTNMHAVLETYSKASPVNAERCVFDICGGNYRLIVAFKFTANVAFIKFIGTHARYDRISAATVSEF
jgi:mRNA interferase HigB